MNHSNNISKPISEPFQKILAVVFLAINIALSIYYLFSKDSLALVIIVVLGLPLLLVSLSILFGSVKKHNRGIFSNSTLYFISSVFILGGVYFSFHGLYRSGLMFFVAFVLAALAKQRKSLKN